MQCRRCHMWCNQFDVGHVSMGVCIFCDTISEEWETADVLRGLINDSTDDTLELWVAYHGLLKSIGTMVRCKRANTEEANLFSTILATGP